MFGLSPSDYRAAHKPAPESPSGTHFQATDGYHPPDYGDLPPVEVREIPPMRVVFLRHTGPYDQAGATWGPYSRLGETYQRLFGGWLPNSGYELRNSPAFEEYPNSPQNTKPEELVTVIHVPVE
jgi:DNA gyrase inhibitor GyrI